MHRNMSEMSHSHILMYTEGTDVLDPGANSFVVAGPLCGVLLLDAEPIEFHFWNSKV